MDYRFYHEEIVRERELQEERARKDYKKKKALSMFQSGLSDMKKLKAERLFKWLRSWAKKAKARI